MEKLPGDILSNILIRLPAKQLAQTRCVSKPLCALLSQPGFIKSHRHHHSLHNKDDDILLVFNHLYLNNDGLCMTIHHSKSPNIIKVNDLIKLPVNFPSIGSCYKVGMISVIGSVNGLICFHSYESSLCDPAIHIWNPSLSALIALPPYDHDSDSVVFGEFAEFFFRFGYDPKTDDYKVVKLMHDNDFARQLDNESDSPDWTQVEVYSMRKQSWKSITEMFPVDVKSIFNGNEVCIDGHDGRVHWLCSYVVEGIELLTIVAFDLFAEAFHVIYLPDSIRENKAGRLNSLGFLAGRLCFMSHIRHGEFEVWVMHEYGVAESWVKHWLSSQLSGTNMNPIGFTLNNKFVYHNYGPKEADYTPIALYDLYTTTVKSFNSRLNLYGNTKVVHYVDSLVWV